MSCTCYPNCVKHMENVTIFFGELLITVAFCIWLHTKSKNRQVDNL